MAALSIKKRWYSHLIFMKAIASYLQVFLPKESVAIDMATHVNDLGRVGAYIHIAYNGVGATGPKSMELQIEVQDLGYDRWLLHTKLMGIIHHKSIVIRNNKRMMFKAITSYCEVNTVVVS